LVLHFSNSFSQFQPSYTRYDGDMYDNTTHMMQMYDVGMSSLFVQEAYSLSILADIIGKDPKIVSSLRVRGDAMRNLIQQHLWDPKQEAFVNRLALQDVFVQHVTPTSFYPMAIGAGTDDQDQMMAQSWLLNASRFCLSPRGDFEGNDPEKCYWGLPSISADDPTYMQNKWVYWRGYTWGPMSQVSVFILLVCYLVLVMGVRLTVLCLRLSFTACVLEPSVRSKKCRRY